MIFVIDNEIEERVKTLSSYIIETGCTVRGAATRFNVSKSTVHKDISERLEKINPTLWKEAKQVLERNKEERHIRGGMATKIKYERKKA